MVFSDRDSKPRNPYFNIKAIHNPEMFFGRRKILERIFDSIGDQQNVALIGFRRIGKSSLLACMRLPEIQNRYSERDLSKHILVLIDLEEHLQRTQEDFFRFLCDQLILQSTNQLQLEMIQRKSADDFSHLLDQIRMQGYHPVLLLDELDSSTRNPQFNSDFFAFLRAQAEFGRVSYIVATFTSLEQLSHPDYIGSPFFNIFSHQTLGPLTQDEAIELITKPSTVAGCPFAEPEIRWIMKLAGCHPFFIQRTCYFLFEKKCRSNNGHINYRDIKHQVYTELLPHFEHAWTHLEVEKQGLLIREASIVGSHQRKIPELSDSLLFRQFVRDREKIKPLQITPEVLKTVLERLDDLTFLGESPLSDLNIIYTQGKDPSKSAIERGILLRQVLQNALDKLRPLGSQHELSSDWQTYNILNNCYFKRARRSNRQLASFLGFSERDFYRKRDRAVEVLLNILFEMEVSFITQIDMEEDNL